ncbi:MAG TPA: nitroreductase family protein [Selenomonadales bacterium]|nr:nitroreductase family protein [Selenomonadales bacterium]
MSEQFWNAVKARRTIYGLSKESDISQGRIEDLVKDAVRHAPSAFNSQSARVVVLFGEQHDKLWNIVKDCLRKIVPPENFGPTEEKIASFQSGYGSILYFEDMSVVESLQQQFQAYKDNFPIWSNHSSGMLQYIVWTALETEGLGASLQHYNPLIDGEVKQAWNIPSHWKLIAEMPFGKPTLSPGEKQFQPLVERVKVYK